MSNKIPQKESPKLSRRETQILKLLLAEYTPTEISKALEIHLNTVCGTRRSVMNKWKVNSMVGLVKEGIKRGYLELEDDPIIGPIIGND